MPAHSKASDVKHHISCFPFFTGSFIWWRLEMLSISCLSMRRSYATELPFIPYFYYIGGRNYFL